MTLTAGFLRSLSVFAEGCQSAGSPESDRRSGPSTDHPDDYNFRRLAFFLALGQTLKKKPTISAVRRNRHANNAFVADAS